jgi:hypothetical protein
MLKRIILYFDKTKDSHPCLDRNFVNNPKHMQKLIVFMVVAFSPFLLMAQQHIKIEREKKISAEEFPDAAMQLIRPLLENARAAKFYQETNQDGINYEAKLKYDKRFYSIEFDSLQQLKDVEELLDWKKASDIPRAILQQELDEKFRKVKVTRIQKQYILKSSVKQLQSLPPSEEVIVSLNYEIEVEGEMHQKNALQFYELLFDEHGKLLQQRVILKNTTDNLIF